MRINPRIVIAEIKDKDFIPGYTSPKDIEYSARKASRGILLRDGKIALLHVTKENYYKLPGGGIEGNETNEAAFIREMREETGCTCKIDQGGEIGVTLEWRDQFRLFQISYIFTATVVGEPQETEMTEEEISEGFTLQWVSPEEAEEIIAKDKPLDYEGHFIQIRDRAIIHHYRNLII